jgi:hypothetical protein
VTTAIPKGHYLVCYDYGTGGLWWLIKAEAAEEISSASGKLSVIEVVPAWMNTDEIERDDI